MVRDVYEHLMWLPMIIISESEVERIAITVFKFKRN